MTEVGRNNGGGESGLAPADYLGADRKPGVVLVVGAVLDGLCAKGVEHPEVVQQLVDSILEVSGPGDRYFLLFDEAQAPIEANVAAGYLARGATVVVLELEYRGADEPPRIVGAPISLRSEDDAQRVLRRQLHELLPDARNPELRLVAPLAVGGSARAVDALAPLRVREGRGSRPGR